MGLLRTEWYDSLVEAEAMLDFAKLSPGVFPRSIETSDGKVVWTEFTWTAR